jgi:ATP-binding cassette, subfamily B, bacterial
VTQRLADLHAAAVPSWSDRLGGLREFPRFLRLVWSSHRGYATAMVVLRVARGVMPAAILVVGKLILDAAAAASRGADPAPLWRYLLIELALVAAADLLAEASAIVESLLGDVLVNAITLRLMEHASTLDLAQLEEPQVQDHLERARAQSNERLRLLTQLLALGQDAITLAALASALLGHSVWLGALLVASTVPAIVASTHFAGLRYSLLFRFTPQRRLLGYLEYVAAGSAAAKEVHLYDLGPWLVARYRRLAEAFMAANRGLALRQAAATWSLTLLGALGYYLGYATILLAVVRQEISLGTMVFLVASFARCRDLLQRGCQSASQINEHCLYLRDLFAFLALGPRARATGGRRVPRPIATGLRFEDVSFRYPGSERWALRDVSFVLRPGDRLAIVGENGAGKTTIAKLLARFYDPTDGRVFLDGVDLREFDLRDLRRSIGAVFQDFFRLQMRFDENSGIGDIETVTPYLEMSRAEQDATGVPDRIRTAAARSLADSLLPQLPDGYAQMLGRYFAGGVDLSGGEWQKVALARAYMRDSQLLILDEPTAALDARAEHAVFQRFSDMTRGRMAVFITHRLWTVQMANHVVVLAGGRSVEQGGHEELLARRGLYAELFELQASGYAPEARAPAPADVVRT